MDNDKPIYSIEDTIKYAKILLKDPVANKEKLDKLSDELKEQVNTINRINESNIVNDYLQTAEKDDPEYMDYSNLRDEISKYAKNSEFISLFVKKEYNKIAEKKKGKKKGIKMLFISGSVAIALATFGIICYKNSQKNKNKGYDPINNRPTSEVTFESTTEMMTENTQNTTENTTVTTTEATTENTKNTTENTTVASTESTTESTQNTTENTTVASTEATTEKTQNTTENTTVASTEATTESTQNTTENTTENTTVASTESTTENTQSTTENTTESQFSDEEQNTVADMFRAMKSDIIELYTSNEAKLAREKGKEFVINTIDFLFYGASINGMTFKDLRGDLKEELYGILQGMDSVVSYFDPDYKEELGEKYSIVKDFASEKYDQAKDMIIEKIGQEKYDEIINKKEEILDKITTVFKKYGGKVLDFINDKYQNFKHK